MDQITPALSLQNEEIWLWGHYYYDRGLKTLHSYSIPCCRKCFVKLDWLPPFMLKSAHWLENVFKGFILICIILLLRHHRHAFFCTCWWNYQIIRWVVSWKHMWSFVVLIAASKSLLVPFQFNLTPSLLRFSSRHCTMCSVQGMKILNEQAKSISRSREQKHGVVRICQSLHQHKNSAQIIFLIFLFLFFFWRRSDG